MLIKFEMENFKNFKGKYTFDLSNPCNYGFNDEVVSEEYGCITKGIIYGPNGSGKSNLGLALFDIVAQLTDNNVIAQNDYLYSCLESKKKTVDFKYTFRFGKHTLVYAYSKQTVDVLLQEKITIDDDEVIFYDYRDNEGYSNLKGSEELNLAANKNNRISRVKYILGTSVLEENEVNKVFTDFGEFVNHMLLFFCLDNRGYQGFTVGAERMTKGILEHSNVKEFENFLREEGIEYSLVEKDIDGEKQIYCHYPNGDVNFFAIASTGTKSLALFYYWYVQMKNTSFVFIDEFDAFYHFDLAKATVNLLKRLTGTQILLTTHNTDLMSNDLLRPDCYFLIEEGRIIPVSDATDKELRKAHNLQKMYKAGAFS